MVGRVEEGLRWGGGLRMGVAGVVENTIEGVEKVATKVPMLIAGDICDYCPIFISMEVC